METKTTHRQIDSSYLYRRMQEAGVKPSLQRMAVLEYLETHCNHPTVDMIYIALHPSVPTLSKTTVYNTLRLFCRAGLACSLNLDPQNQRFDGQMHPHHHFICRNCGKVLDIPADKKTVKPELPAALKKFEVFRTEVSYFGICSDCGQHKNENINP